MRKKKKLQKDGRMAYMPIVERDLCISPSSTLWIVPSEGMIPSASSTSTSGDMITQASTAPYVFEMPNELQVWTSSIGIENGMMPSQAAVLETESSARTESPTEIENATIRELRKTYKNIIDVIKREHLETRIHFEKKLKLALDELATKDEIIKILDEKINIVFSFKQLTIPLLYFFVATIATAVSATFLLSSFMGKAILTQSASSLFLIFSLILLYTSFCHIKDIMSRTR